MYVSILAITACMVHLEKWEKVIYHADKVKI